MVLQHITFREATVDDIKQIQTVRNSVTENMLSNPNLVTDKHCEEFLTIRGKGWVCEVDNEVVGFAIADLVDLYLGTVFNTKLREKRHRKAAAYNDVGLVLYTNKRHSLVGHCI